MPEPVIVKISEIFFSAQGEGARSGVPAVFLRLAGCSLGCPFCDTPQALSGGEEMEITDVLDAVFRLAPRGEGTQVVITGGEPLEQDLGRLIVELGRAGYFLSVETNGIHYQDLAVDWWTVSPKPGNGFRVHSRLRDKAEEVKIVVTPEVTPDQVGKVRDSMPRPPIFLQPNARDPRGYVVAWDLFNRCVREGISGVRLGVQLHRVYRIP